MTTTVTAYINLGPDNFAGWQPGHLIAEAATFRVADVEQVLAAEAAFHIGNRQGADLDGAEWPADIRSLSVGDLVKVRDDHGVSFWVCERFGWKELAEPSNPVLRADREEIAAAAARVRDEYVLDTLRALWRLAA